MRVALIGQPNCGKSTLFNQVAGYKAETGNFSGTTVNIMESRVRVTGEIIELVDLPGAFTLEGGSPAEMEAGRYLNSKSVDIIVNVADATQLTTALELTLELLSLKKPVILALNMMDEAARLGLKVDGNGLSGELNIPVLPLVARKGRGVRGVFLKCLEVGKAQNLVTQESTKLNTTDRHSLAKEYAQKFISHGERVLTWRDQLDDVLLHPILGVRDPFIDSRFFLSACIWDWEIYRTAASRIIRRFHESGYLSVLFQFISC